MAAWDGAEQQVGLDVQRRLVELVASNVAVLLPSHPKAPGDRVAPMGATVSQSTVFESTSSMETMYGASCTPPLI